MNDILTMVATDHPRLAPLIPAVRKAVDLVTTSQRAGGWLFACGCGGSAADADHIVGECMKGFLSLRPATDAVDSRLNAMDPAWKDLAPKLQRGIRAMSLAAHPALVSAIANDQHAHLAYAQQVYAAARPGDVVIGLSTSGNSPVVVRALQIARAQGCRTIGFTGERPSAMDQWCDVVIKAPATETYRVQECHLPLYHALCALAEEQLFSPAAVSAH